MALGEIYRSDDADGYVGNLTLLSSYDTWRPGWTQIVPGNFWGGAVETDVLFYEASTGTGEFYRSDGHGGLLLIRRNQGWRHTWTHIVSGKFTPTGLGASQLDALLFYEAGTPNGEIYATDGNGNLILWISVNDWRTDWTHIVSGSWGPTGRGLLFYEASTGTGEFYAFDNDGLALMKAHEGWRTTWTHIVPGQFAGWFETDVFFYDAASGTGEIYESDGEGGIILRSSRRLRAGWTHIVPGPFGDNNYTGLLFYDANTGMGEFFASDGQGGLCLVSSNRWPAGWTKIVSGRFVFSHRHSDLLVYRA